MKKRVLSALLTLVMLFTLIPATAVTAFAEESAELFANTCAVTFTTPSDVVLTVSEGFAVGMNEKINDGKTMKVVTPVSQSTEGDVTSHLYNLPEGTYRFLAMGEDSVGGKPADGAKVVKYYNWDKNFIVTAADVAAGSKTIDADPGLLANTGWEQKRTEYSYFVRQFTDHIGLGKEGLVADGNALVGKGGGADAHGRDGEVEPAAGPLFRLGNEVGGQAALFCGLLNDGAVVAGNAQMGGKALSDQTASASKFTAYGNDVVAHGAPPV